MWCPEGKCSLLLLFAPHQQPPIGAPSDPRVQKTLLGANNEFRLPVPLFKVTGGAVFLAFDGCSHSFCFSSV